MDVGPEKAKTSWSGLLRCVRTTVISSNLSAPVKCKSRTKLSRSIPTSFATFKAALSRETGSGSGEAEATVAGTGRFCPIHRVLLQDGNSASMDCRQLPVDILLTKVI